MKTFPPAITAEYISEITTDITNLRMDTSEEFTDTATLYPSNSSTVD